MKYDFNCTLAKMSADELARKIEEYAANGWELASLFENGAGFEKTSPQKIHAYAELGKSPSDEKIRFYKDFGWEYKCGFAFCSVYISHSENPVPIDTDRQEQAQALKRSAHYTIIVNVITATLLLLIMTIDITDFANILLFTVGFSLISFVYLIKIMRVVYNCAKEAMEGCDMDTSSLTRKYRAARIYCIAATALNMTISIAATIYFAIAVKYGMS